MCREAAWPIATEINVDYFNCNGKEHRRCIVKPEEGFTTRNTVEGIKERGRGIVTRPKRCYSPDTLPPPPPPPPPSE